MEFNVTIFGERLKELRNEKGISTITLGRDLGLSDGTISRWENGIMKPTVDSVFKLAKYFNVSSDYLLGLANHA